MRFIIARVNLSMPDRITVLLEQWARLVIPRVEKIAKNRPIGMILGTQLLKSATSIGANIREARASQSRKDFIAKLFISRKECAETYGWLDQLSLAGLLAEKEKQQAVEILIQIHKIVNKSIGTARKNGHKN